MNLKVIVAGLISFGIGFTALIPDIVLTIARSPVKSETDLAIITGDAITEGLDNAASKNVLEDTKAPINLIGFVPHILIFTGIIICIGGFFIE